MNYDDILTTLSILTYVGTILILIYVLIADNATNDPNETLKERFSIVTKGYIIMFAFMCFIIALPFTAGILKLANNGIDSLYMLFHKLQAKGE